MCSESRKPKVDGLSTDDFAYFARHLSLDTPQPDTSGRATLSHTLGAMIIASLRTGPDEPGHHWMVALIGKSRGKGTWKDNLQESTTYVYTSRVHHSSKLTARCVYTSVRTLEVG